MNQAAVTGCATDAETVSIGRSRAVGGAQLAILGLLILLLPLGIRFTDRTGPEPLKAASALPALGFPGQNPFARHWISFIFSSEGCLVRLFDRDPRPIPSL
jgi:hypothetical protein